MANTNHLANWTYLLWLLRRGGRWDWRWLSRGRRRGWRRLSLLTCFLLHWDGGGWGWTGGTCFVTLHTHTHTYILTHTHTHTHHERHLQRWWVTVWNSQTRTLIFHDVSRRAVQCCVFPIWIALAYVTYRLICGLDPRLQEPTKGILENPFVPIFSCAAYVHCKIWPCAECV
jgi:hypothetical protein